MKKVIIAAALIFTSSAMFAQQKAKDAEKRTPAQRVEKQVERMKTELNLTSEQAEQVKVALQKRTEIVAVNKKAKQEAMSNIKTANKEFTTEMEKVLSPEQLAKFNQIKEERENKAEMESKD